jgi:hypothetical protein
MSNYERWFLLHEHHEDEYRETIQGKKWNLKDPAENQKYEAAWEKVCSLKHVNVFSYE